MEKYGTIPKRFTKEWWSYYWMYYKWHTIVGIVALLAVLITAVQCAQTVDYDLYSLYIPPAAYDEARVAHISEQLAQSIDDMTGDGRALVNGSVIALSSITNVANDYDLAMVQKAYMELQVGDSYLFIINGNLMQEYVANGTADYFEPVDAYLPDSFDRSKLNAMGMDVCRMVPLDGNKLFEEAGLPSKNMYLAVKSLYQVNEESPEHQAWYENAKKAAARLLEQ